MGPFSFSLFFLFVVSRLRQQFWKMHEGSWGETARIGSRGVGFWQFRQKSTQGGIKKMKEPGLIMVGLRVSTTLLNISIPFFIIIRGVSMALEPKNSLNESWERRHPPSAQTIEWDNMWSWVRKGRIGAHSMAIIDLLVANHFRWKVETSSFRISYFNLTEQEWDKFKDMENGDH